MVMHEPNTPTPRDDESSSFSRGVSALALTAMRAPLHAGSAMQVMALPQRHPAPPTGHHQRTETAPTHTSLSRSRVSGSDRAHPQGFVVAVMVAHEAESRISAALRALHSQSRPVDAVIVVTDNCTDYTAVMALAAGATIVDAAGNSEGRHGALNLALAEVVEMLDDTDLVLIVEPDVTLDPEFVARATRRMWTPTTDTTVAAVRRVTTGSGNSEPAHAGVYLVGALRTVMTDRRNLLLPDRSTSAGVFDTGAVAPYTELAVALEATGHGIAEAHDNTTDSGRSGTTMNEVFNTHRHHQHGLLDALSAHGFRRPLRRTLVTELRSLVTIAMVPAAVVTAGIMPMWSFPLLGLALVAWVARRAWSVRGDGWRAATSAVGVVQEMGQAVIAGVGRFAGSARWLHGLPSLWGRRSPRQPTWAHGHDRPGGFDPPPLPSATRRRRTQRSATSSTAALTLVRVPGPSIVIERVADNPDDLRGGWRNHAVVALAMAILATMTVGIPMASLPVAWGLLIAIATISIVVNVTTMVTNPVD
jgi:biofilm PGA synthesis N-glycosyltransferase PgaC